MDRKTPLLKKNKRNTGKIGRGGGRRISQEERNAEVLRARLIIGGIAAVILMWVLQCIFYAGHFEKNSYVNGVDVSSLSLKAARAKLAEEIPENYSIMITGPDGREELISGAGLNIEIVSAKNAKKALKKQKALCWLTENGKEKSYEIELEVSYNADALNNAVSGLAMMQEEDMIAPVNASIFENSSGHYEINAEVTGTTLRVDEVREAIGRAVAGGQDRFDATAYQTLPEVTSENENLVRRRDQWNNYMNSEGMTYRVCEATVTFDGLLIARLLTDDGNTVVLDKQKIRDLVAEWSYEYNTYNKQFSFTTYYGKEIVVDPYGSYGYEIQDDTLPDEIYDHITAGDRGSYEVSYYHKPLYNYNNGLGGNYVEIDVDRQHLWVWKDGEVLLDTPVVTGLPVYGRTTYYGCYAINLMQEHAVLGDVNVEGYESEVRYWVRFNSGEGIHDADWRDVFGGQIWLYAGSHGCVNVPVDEMPAIYANVELGEAVVVYGHEYDPAVWDPATKEVNMDYYETFYYQMNNS